MCGDGYASPEATFLDFAKGCALSHCADEAQPQKARHINEKA